MERSMLIPLSGSSWVLFPWLGTRSFRTLRRYLGQFSDTFRISKMEFAGSYYLQFRMERGTGEELLKTVKGRIQRCGIDADSLIAPTETPVYEKYDSFIPGELLRIAYREDKLNTDEVVQRSEEWGRDGTGDAGRCPAPCN